LAARWHPELRDTTYYTTMGTADALRIAVQTLDAQYVQPMQLRAIQDQAVATALLSFGVNAGVRVAMATFQRAVNSVFASASVPQPGAHWTSEEGALNSVFPSAAGPLKVDGVCGPETLSAANRCLPQSLLNGFRVAMARFYVELCNQRAADRNELLGWLNRALA
jgi:lysozyme family protein